MKLSFNRYPVDIIICMIWSIILLPIGLLQIEGTLRIILGLPFILFIPGYTLIFALFPSKKTDLGIDIIERIALSFGLSITVSPLIGLGLNFTPWGIRLEPILISLFLFIIIMGFIGFIRWIKTNPKERFIISLNLELSKKGTKIDLSVGIVLKKKVGSEINANEVIAEIYYNHPGKLEAAKDLLVSSFQIGKEKQDKLPLILAIVDKNGTKMFIDK